MAKQYVGARYVPKFASPIEWAPSTYYEALTIVTFNNASYTSKVPVPPAVGNPAKNPQYWVLTGNYNSQVEQYRQETENYNAQVGQYRQETENYKTEVEGYRQDTENYNTQVEEYRQTTENYKQIVDSAVDSTKAILNTKVSTPEDFGAMGDGSNDDTTAIKNWLNSDNYVLLLPHKTYKCTQSILCEKSHLIIGNNGTILFDQNSEITINLRLLKFNNIDNLILENINIKIEATTNSPFSDDNIPDHDGLLVDISNCNNLYIDGCSFSVIDNGKTIPCTPMWIREGGASVYITNSKFINKGMAQRSGALWTTGDYDSFICTNSILTGSTLDEVTYNFDTQKGFTSLYANCLLSSLAKNDNFTAINENMTVLFDNCTFKFATGVVNYQGIKNNGGTVKFADCIFDYYDTVTGGLFTGTAGNTIVEGCVINYTHSSTNNGGIFYGRGATIKASNNIINLHGVHTNVIFYEKKSDIALNNNTIINHDSENEVGFFNNTSGAIFTLINNVIYFNNRAYTYMGSTSPTKYIYQNIYIGIDSIPSDIANQNIPA